MIKKILTLIVCTRTVGNLYAQSSFSNEMVYKYKKFLNGTFDTQEGCTNPNASKSTTNYFPMGNDLIGGELRVVRDNISKIVNSFTIENIELFDASKGLYKLEVIGKNEITGKEFESIRIMQFDGSSTRTISRIDDGNETVSDGVIISSGLETKSFFNCSNINKNEVQKKSASLSPNNDDNFRISNYVPVSDEVRSWIIFIVLVMNILLTLFFAFKIKQSAGKAFLNNALTDIGGGSFSTQVFAFCMTIIYIALCIFSGFMVIMLPIILRELI